jgi:flavin reductase (DIM6/NTAB) family NADH-FMN oxidoreductase RutF
MTDAAAGVHRGAIGRLTVARCGVTFECRRHRASETSTHVLIEGYAKGFSAKAADPEVKRVREGISARFR